MTDEIVKTESSTELATFDAEMAKYAREAAEAEKSAGMNFLKFKGGIYAGKTQIKDNQVDLVVLDAVGVNELYEGDYDPDKLEAPACYAIGRDDATMKPHPKVKAPKCESCAACPFNQWGSGKKGKGKACKNTKRIATIAAGEHPESEDLYYGKLSVSQIKNWGAYVKSLAGQYQLPPFAVVTRIKWAPDPVSQYKLSFLMVKPLPREGMDTIMRRVREAREGIAFPFPDFEPKAEPAESEQAPKKPKKY